MGFPKHQLFLAFLVSSLIIAFPYIFFALPGIPAKVLALAVGILPPFGYFNLATPLNASGLYFPRFGLIGVLLMAVLIIMVYYRPGFLIVGLIIISTQFFMGRYSPAFNDNGWTPLSTTLGKSIRAEFDPQADYIAQGKIFSLIENQRSGGKFLLPESAAGRWTRACSRRWTRFVDKANVEVLIGTEFKSGGHLYNALVHLSPGNDPSFPYIQRLPVPWFMWRKGRFSRSRGLGTFTLDGKTWYAGLICYEAVIPICNMTIFFRSKNRVDAVFVVSNTYWSRSKSKFRNRLREVNRSWSLLFNTPYISAMNS